MSRTRVGQALAFGLLLAGLAGGIGWKVGTTGHGPKADQIFGLDLGKQIVGDSASGKIGAPVSFSALMICAKSPLRISTVKPLVMTGSATLRAGLSPSFHPATTHLTPSVPDGRKMPASWTLGKPLPLCGSNLKAAAAMAVLNIEITRHSAAPVNVKGLVVTFIDSKGVSHTVRTKSYIYGIRADGAQV